MSGGAARMVVAACTAWVLAACSGEGGIDHVRFAESSRSPGPEQVYLEDELIVGESATLSVRVRDLVDVGAADLTLVYDPAVVVYRAFGPGSLLERGGSDVAYDVFEEQPGRLRVRVTRLDPGGVDAGTDNPSLVLLRFSVVREGQAPLSFDPGSEVLDDVSDPLPGVSFFGGALIAS